MPEPTIADALLEVLQRPYFDDQPFTILELLAIAQAEKLFPKPLNAAAIRLRINHLIRVGKVLRVDGQHVLAIKTEAPS